MSLFNDLIAALPELEGSNAFADGLVVLQDDSDGLGAYIAKWDYSKPMPEGFKLGK
jgi:hypothetical protein